MDTADGKGTGEGIVAAGPGVSDAIGVDDVDGGEVAETLASGGFATMTVGDGKVVGSGLVVEEGGLSERLEVGEPEMEMAVADQERGMAAGN